MLEETLQKALIQKGRDFMKGNRADDPYDREFESDQQLRRPQPPLVKAALQDTEKVALSRTFDDLSLQTDLADLFRNRKSTRVYTGQEMNLTQLSFLLWATQGVRGIRGRSYATLRTVPSGGARHPFETYLIVLNVTDLKPGAYHYLPMDHALEFLGPVPHPEDTVSRTLSGQRWAARANVVFYWTMVPYRAEWRYGIYAHRVALIDVGHVGENLYLACAGLGLGTCGIGAFSHEVCNRVFRLDGEEEFMVYAAPVGTRSDEDQAAEQSFYSFLKDENL